MPAPEIGISELNKIRSLVAGKQVTNEDRRRQDKKALCDRRVARWPNTLNALRQKKENAYKERAERLEASRLANDREEEVTKAKDRRQKIELATKLIYKQTDKMKRLNAAELLADCIAERKQQIELNRRVQEAETGWEVQFREMERKDREFRKDREDREVADRKATARNIARTQQEQLAEVTQRYISELTEQKEEGMAIAAKAREDQLEDNRKELTRLAEGRVQRQELIDGNAALLVVRQEYERQEALEDAKIAAFAARKEELKARQVAQSAKMEGEKTRRRQKMIDKQTKLLAAARHNEGARIDGQVKEALAAEDARNDKRDNDRRLFRQSIDKSRSRQLAAKQAQSEATHAKELKFAEAWRQHNKRVELEDIEERLGIRAEAKDHQAFLRAQADEKHVKESDSRRREIMEAQRIQIIEDNEDEKFRAIALRRIAAKRSEGKDPYPLQKCLLDTSKGQGIMAAF